MEYIGIAEFAERVGVTPQAVYRRLKTDLAPFVKVENGVKSLSVAALELYSHTLQSKREQGLQERVEELEKEVEQLKAEKLELYERLTANNEKLLEMLANHQVLLAQNQNFQQALLTPPATVESENKEVENKDNKRNKPGLIKRLFAPKKN